MPGEESSAGPSTRCFFVERASGDSSSFLDLARFLLPLVDIVVKFVMRLFVSGLSKKRTENQ